jgi:hypothetical protein
MAKLSTKLIGIAVAIVSTSTFATNIITTNRNFSCPDPVEVYAAEIKMNATDFTSPIIWTAPAMPHTARGTVGFGLGGKKAGEFLGAEPGRIGSDEGWICVYRSEGGVGINAFESAIREQAVKISYLRQFVKRIDAEIAKADPYVEKYKDKGSLGFIAYKMKEKKGE